MVTHLLRRNDCCLNRKTFKLRRNPIAGGSVQGLCAWSDTTKQRVRTRTQQPVGCRWSHKCSWHTLASTSYACICKVCGLQTSPCKQYASYSCRSSNAATSSESGQQCSVHACRGLGSNMEHIIFIGVVSCHWMRNPESISQFELCLLALLAVPWTSSWANCLPCMMCC